MSLTLAVHAQRRVIVVCRVGQSVGRLVGRSLCTHVFSRTVAAVDTKRGYVGMCNGRSAQQESGTSLSKNHVFTGGRIKFTLMCTFLVKAESGGYQTWICG